MPVGSWLYFAGEHTSTEYWGTVHGAILSGRSAVQDLGDSGVVLEGNLWVLGMGIVLGLTGW